MTKIKICGLSKLCDIEAVNLAQPDYIGFVFAESRRQVSPAQALALRNGLSPLIIPVGIFVNEAIHNILPLIRHGVISAVQLHGNEDEGYVQNMKSLTDVPIIKAVPIEKEGAAQHWQNSCADYLLLDKKGGGTGTSFDWNLIGQVSKPFFLAGGLQMDNIEAALRQVRPFGIDISSGVETNGSKDREKIQSIVRRVRNGQS